MDKQKMTIVMMLLSGATLCNSTAAFTRENITDHGAVPGGEHLNTQAIQSAIDQCHENGGGTVYLPPGTWLSGTIVLKSHVNLHLEPGAVLLGSTNLEDYPEKYPEFRSYTDVNYVDKSLIYAEKAENISITGQGTIDGQGEEKIFDLPGGREHFKSRPFTIRMIECTNVKIRDVSIVNSPMWVQHYLACDDLLIDGITVDSQVNWNNDGIDIDACRQVRISNCNIISGDDAIVLKATAPRDCEQVVVTNCVLSTHCNAFKLGTESVGGFKDIVFSNSVIHDTRRTALAIEMVDGGTAERIQIMNITINGANGGIFIRLGNRARHHLALGSGGTKKYRFTENNSLDPVGMGSMRDIILSNITGKGIDDIGCSITGLPQYKIENLKLHNVCLEYQGGGKADLVDKEVPEMEKDYPEYKMFGKLPAYGFYVRHVRNISFSGVSTSYEAEEYRPALIFDDVRDLQLEDLDLQAPAGSAGTVVYRHTSEIRSDQAY